ncbi:signal peptidase I [candidate division WOR-3 bacterium]|nr:signal peptidase I [candidate division WOR-3 bacterium]
MKKKKSKLRGWIEDLIFVVVAVLLIRAYVIQAYRIPTGSMERTLLVGDHLFACKFLYGIRIPFTDKRILEFREPRRGDIIVFRFPYERKDFVKRCIAVEGDIVEIKDKQAYVNNRLLYEPYTHHGDPGNYARLEIPEFEYQRAWVRGEFRNAGAMIRDNFGPVRVPNGCMFMIGDNRDFSFDSRFWGPLEKKWIRGKVLVLYFSWNKEPPLYKIWKKVRWKRIGNIVH